MPTHASSSVTGSVLKRFLIAVLCVLMLSCSATRLVYNQLDWLVVWYISDFFTLDDEQEDHLRVVVEENIAWHRADQLPKYALFARDLERLVVSESLTADELEDQLERSIRLWDEFIVQVTPASAAFFRTLSEEQVLEFVVNLEEQNQELWDEYAGSTPEQRIKRRQKSTIKGIERMTGRLTRDQKTLVRSYLDSMHDVSDEWIAGRRRWQTDFRDLVLERPPEPAFSERMLDMMIDPNQTDRPEYRQLVAENRQIMLNLVAALNGELTDKQRNRFSKKLLKYARNFEILSAEKLT